MRNAAAASFLRRIISFSFVFILLFAWTAPTGLTQTTSYIIQGDNTDSVARLVEQYGGRITSRLDIIGGVGAQLTAEAAAALRTEPVVRSVTLNAVVEAADSEGGTGRNSPATDYPEVVGADVVWQNGVTGDGVTVAVVDTGIGWHRGLIRGTDGKLKGRLLSWIDFVDGKRNPIDPNGHGSHVAGIILNSQRGNDGQWNGIAPGADLVVVRVLDKEGKGTYERVIKGIQWVVDHKDRYNIRVMNLSMVAAVQSPYWADPLNRAVTQAWASGIVVVVAAGNAGPGPLTVGVPGNNPYVITAGAFTDNYTPSDWSDDYITPFSSAGPTLDAFVKPDVVAPGAHMVSTMMPHTYLATTHGVNQVTNHYFWMAGTSQAAATTSGIAALVLSHNSSLTPDQVKYRLMSTAYVWIEPGTTHALYSMWQQGAGRVNAPGAVFSEINGSVNNGMDIQADLAGTTHYEGYSYFDTTTNTFKLHSGTIGGADFGTWAGGYGTWAGDFGTWAGDFGTWAGDFGTWAGDFGTWAGDFGTWAGDFGTWAGDFGTWAGDFGTWAGDFGTWAGDFGTWAGGYSSWASDFGTWAGDFGTWAGDFGTWAGDFGTWAGSAYLDPAFIDQFEIGTVPTLPSANSSFIEWVDEP